MSLRDRKDLFRELPFATAEDLLDALAPHVGQDLWGRADQNGWVFRGQAEAIWHLRPSALRPNAFVGFIHGQVVMPHYSLEERRGLEAAVVNEFASFVSNFGFEVPGDSQHLRDIEYVRGHDGSDFPDIEHRAIYALAQHYRVPTRLLDWTRRPLVAAYFAARDVVEPQRKPPSDSDGRFALWAVQHGFVNRICREWDPGAVVVTVPTVSNPNLYAQMGLFTLVRFIEAPGPDKDIPDLDALFTAPENVERARRIEHLLPLPMLFKFTVPQTEAPKLLHYLDLQYVNAASVYPGRHSIVPYMHEGNLRSVCRPLARR